MNICLELFLQCKECPDICEYKHGPYCNRMKDDPEPQFNKGPLAQQIERLTSNQ